jgi:hypothetical protein
VKYPVPAVVTTTLEDFSKGDAEPMTLPEKNLCLVGRKWVYPLNRWKAKKLIPVEFDNNIDSPTAELPCQQFVPITDAHDGLRIGS